MRLRLISGFLLIAAAFSLTVQTARAAAGEMNFEAQLIWGSNDSTPPSSKLKPVGPKLEEKLKKSPFRWEHYYEVNQEKFTVALHKEKAVTMSKECEIRVANLGNQQIKFQLYGKGTLANTVTQALPLKELLITGGNSENSTGWFVVLRQTE